MKKLTAVLASALAAVAAVADATTSLTATRSTDGNGYAVLAWDGDETEVYRAYSAENPNWLLAGSVAAGAQTFTDVNGYYGIKTYYKVGGQVVSFTRMRRLGQNEDASLLSGVTVVWNGTNYGYDGNTGEKSFDGDCSTAANLVWGDAWYGSAYNAPVGLDLDKPYHVALARIAAARADDYSSRRVRYSMVWGSNNLTTFDGATQLSGMVDYVDYLDPVEGTSFKELECDSTVAYQRVFVQKQSDDQPSCGNYAEIEFYGWSDDDLAGLTDPVTDFTVAPAGNRQIAVSWNCTGTPDEFIVERQVDGGAWAVLQPVIAQSGFSYSFADADVAYYSTYAYRVTARYAAFDVSQVSSVVSAKCVEPMNLTVACGDLSTTFNAVLTWQNCASLPADAPTAVWRSDDQGATWTKLATVAAGTLAYTDISATTYGVKYLYRVTPDADGTKVSDICTFRYVHRLGQRADASLLPGVTILKEGSDIYSGTGANTGERCFDGNTGTYADVDNPSNPRIGLNFAQPSHIAFVRLITRTTGQYGAGRVDRSVVFASNSDWNNLTAISAPLDYGDWAAPLEWKIIECDPTTAYSLAVLRRNDGQNTNGNFSEIEFYGWSVDDLAEPVTDFTLTVQEGGIMDLSWACAGAPDAFILERQVNGGEWTTYRTITAASDAAAYANRRFVDTDVSYYSTYAYRISARYDSIPLTLLCWTTCSAECVEPMNLALSYSDLSRNYYAVLNWENCATIDGKRVAVYRSAKPDVWTKIAVVAAGTLTYTDTQARTYGVCYRYRIAPEESGALKPSNIVDYYRVRRLDVRDGNGYPVSDVATVVTAWDQNDSGRNSFDGRTDTYSSMNAYGSPHFGLSFGETPVYVGLVRILPRQGELDTEHLNRLDGLAAFGTNTSGDWSKNYMVSSSVPADRADKQAWVNLAGIPTGPWKIVYFWNQTWQGNAAEIEIYGWTDEDMKGGFMLIIY